MAKGGTRITIQLSQKSYRSLAELAKLDSKVPALWLEQAVEAVIGSMSGKITKARKASRLVYPAFPFPLIVLYAALIHTAWGFAFIIGDGKNLVSAPTSLLFRLVGGGEAGGTILLGAATLAVVALYIYTQSHIWKEWMLIPQQTLLVMSAWSAIGAIVGGHYPDGTVRSPMFIFADQIPVIILAAIHVILYSGLGTMTWKVRALLLHEKYVNHNHNHVETEE